MDNLKQAYEVLGLSENASRQEVEKAFEMLLRRSKSKNNSSPDLFEQQVKAYKFIVNHEDQSIIDHASAQRYSKWGKFADKAEKTDDFFRINKTKIFLSIIGVVVIIAGLFAFMNHREEQKRLAALPPIDLSILYVGNFMVDEQNGGIESLEKALLSQFPDFKRLQLDITYLPPTNEAGVSGADMAYQQKAMAILATERPDIYVMDDATFEWIGKSGIFKNLDEETQDNWKSWVSEATALKVINEDEQKEHVYGIDVSENALFNQLPLYKEKAILTIRDDSENMDKALKFVEHFIQK
ncbi:hypothetical protein D3C77_412240 [compost metagenome]